MSTRPDQGQDDRETREHTDIRFTARGDAALDELAAALIADLTSGLASDSTSAATLDRADIAAVLDRVMNADVEDLAAAVTAAAGVNNGLVDGELALGRDARDVEWETVRAPMIQAGDLTPAGRVDDVELDRDLRRVDLTIHGNPYSRGYEDRVDRLRIPADAGQDLRDVERRLDDPQLELDLPGPDAGDETPETGTRPRHRPEPPRLTSVPAGRGMDR